MKFVTAIAMCAFAAALVPFRVGGQAAPAAGSAVVQGGPPAGGAPAQADPQAGPAQEGVGRGGGRGGGGRGGGQPPAPEPPGFTRVKITSSFDRTEQDAIVVVPQSGDATKPRPLAVFLHAWSVDYTQRQPVVEAEAEQRGWIVVIPNFRGPYNNPNACGQQAAQQDILDAIAYVKQHHSVDEKRVYALGWSGGGFMTMLMVAKYPQIWAAGSEYAGISDLAAWYNEHATDRYADNMKACFGGAPTDSAEMLAKYKAHSPLTYMKPDLGVPLDLHAGRNDTTVVFSHGVRAFQALAPGALSDADTRDFRAGPPVPLLPMLRIEPLAGRQIYVRREVGNVRFTLFEGAHEWVPTAVFAWLEQFQKP